MMESLFALLFCLVLPVIGFIALLVYLGRRGSGPRTVNPHAAPRPDAAAPSPLGLAHYAAFDKLVASWAEQGSLSPQAEAELRARLATHVAESLGPPVPQQPVVAPAASVSRPAPAQAITRPLAAQQPPATQAVPALAPVLAEQAVQPPVPQRRSAGTALRAALLALDTRRVLLFLGTFLLVMSSLTLVIFNWSSLPALVQIAILAGTTAAIWAGGAWMARRPDLATAGGNLQLVAALLMPVVGFALGRPGLLDLEPRPAWLLASCLSLVAYLLTAWRTGRGVYSGAAALAAVSTLLAALGDVALGWQPMPVVLLLAALLPIAHRLRLGGSPQLAIGPRWVALLGAPLATAIALSLALSGGATSYATAATLAAGALFCGLAAWSEGRRPWIWAALVLAPLSAQLALFGADAGLDLRALALAVFALVYFALSEPASARLRPAATPLLVLGLACGALTLPLTLISVAAARLALPALILLGAAAFAGVERGRFSWLGASRPALAAGGLGAAGLLLGAWLGALLAATPLGLGVRGLLLLPLAAAAFAAARWWPGRRGAHYDFTLQAVAASLALVAGSMALTELETRLPGALMLAAIFGWQASLRRGWPWAALSLGAGLLAAGCAIERFVPDAAQLRAATLVALAVATVYSLAGERLRRTALRYWTWPAVGWGALAGLGALALAALQLSPVRPLPVAVLLGLAALLGAHSALWRQAKLGYGAAPLLALGTFLSATQGFFTSWQPAPGDMAYAICGIVLGLALLGQLLRRYGRPYALPYELLSAALLPLAPLAAAGSASHLTFTWAAMAALYGLGLWRYRLPQLLAPAFLALDLALLNGAGWLWPGGEPASAGLLIAGAVWAQALLSAWASRRPLPWGAAGRWGYASALLGGCGALLLAATSAEHSAAVALLLAALLALLVWVEGREELAWGSLALVALGIWRFHVAVGLPAEWSLLIGALEALALFVLGWGVQLLAPRLPRLAPWRRPFEHGVGGATLLLPALLAAYSAYDLTAYSIYGAGPLLGAAMLLVGLALGLLGWRRALPALSGPALASWSLALMVEGVSGSLPGWALQGPYLLLAVALAQGGAAIWAGRRRGAALSYPVYAASLFTGALAFAFTQGTPRELAIIAGSLALLWIVAATVERSAPAAWGALALLVLALNFTNELAGLTAGWAQAWLVLELVGVCLAGWAAALAGLKLWRRPTTLGALGVALLCTALALPLGEALPPLTFALASLGLLLATIAVRERELYYAYAAGAVFVAAALCQLADWGVSEPQWYVLPAGIYLLALAAGLRRFQGQRRASQLVEAAATMLLLGVTFGQALRPEGGLPYSLLLFGESLLLAWYGSLARLRVPFLGGVAFFVAGVAWMSVDSVRLTNQWLLLGAVGLLMVAAYVVLERHQERLLRAGRAWAAQLQSWG